ncbi:MAG: hypothetical protein LBT97_01825 [Planctomycetota bacterium]|jgi:hypothetical protein|nr:hypothetical protein [Planctomycetota bacterium]
MTRLSEFRRRGAIPARRHDAFLLALLLSLALCAAGFALQEFLPRLAAIISLIAPNPAPVEEEEYAPPFVLVDPSLVDAAVSDLPAEAEGNVSRLARQAADRPDLPAGSATMEEGVDVVLTAPEGNPGADVPAGNSDQDLVPPETARVEPEAPPESGAATDPGLRFRQPELPPLPEMTPEPERETPPPAFDTPPPLPEPVPTETIPEPEPPPPALPEPEPEPIPEAASGPVREAEPAISDPDDFVDLAMLPPVPEGFVNQSTRTVNDRAAEPLAPPPAESPPRLRPDELAVPPAAPPSPDASPPRTPDLPPARPRPTFKKLGSEANRAGAPRRRNRESSVKLLGDDASMRILQHRYGAYMEKVARQLQESLNRQAVLNPAGYNRGQVKIRFGIAPDGSLSYWETIYAAEGMDAERILSERTVIEAAPFDPLTPEMRKDENFQKLTVTVNLL